jgi:hypothetical protein
MSVFDLSGAVVSLSSETITVTRYATGVYDSDGYATAKAVSTAFDIKASVQPTSGKDLAQFPEGDDPSNFITIFTVSELLPQDEIETDEGTFYVLKVRNWGKSGNWWKAFARRRNEAEL